MARIDLPPALDMFEKLMAAYSEPHRHYHTTAHIDACLLELDEVQGQITEPDQAELALWFHDAVYRPTSSSNEGDSAAWASRFLTAMGADKVLIENVSNAIMATCHLSTPEDELSKWVVDIDLSILGYSPDDYARFEENIRREYRWIPTTLFRRKRAEVLKSFIARFHIYSTEWFRRKYERQARQNLRDAALAFG